MTDRPERGAALLLGVLVGVVCGACTEPAPRVPRDLIVILVDTLRADRLGSYGYALPSSPHIDRLAAAGATFEDVYTTAPWTLPASASLLTGLYPRRHGLTSPFARRRLRQASWADRMRRHGFLTGAFVNSFYLGDTYGLSRGFDQFSLEGRGPPAVAPSGVVDDAIRWLSAHDVPRVFLFLHLYDVHSDYASEERWEKLFVRPYDGIADGTTGQLMAFRRGEVALDGADAAHLDALYTAGIRQLDEGLGHLLDHLERSGRAERTLVVLTADHGEELLEHGGVLHGHTHYEELIHVPLILSGPGVPRGVRIAAPVSLVDVMPTAMSLLGLPPPDGLDGRDLSPLLRGEASAELASRARFSESPSSVEQPGLSAIRRGDHKLVFDPATGQTLLFDVVHDPEETSDLSADRPELRASLLRELSAFTDTRGPEEGEAPALTPEQVEALRALGYGDAGP